MPEISARIAGILGLAGLKNLRDARQTGGDVRRALDFTRLAGQQRARREDLAFLDVDAGLGGQVVEVENLAVRRILDDDARMAFATVLRDDKTLRDALGLGLRPSGFAFDDVLELHAPRLLGQNRVAVRVPRGQLLAGLDRFAVLDQDRGAVGNLVLFEFAVLGVENGDLAVAPQDHGVFAPVRIGHLDGAQVAILHGPRQAGANVGFHEFARRDAPGVERPHGELRPGFADGLGRDDADRQALLDQLARRKIDAVAAGAHAHRCFAGQRRADADRFEIKRRELVGDLVGDDLRLP